MPLTKEKAKELLRDGTAHGRPLTEKQIKKFKTIASGKPEIKGKKL